jgi:phage tail sheath protein FI
LDVEAPVPDYIYPGVYVEESDPGVHPISGVSTSIAAFVGFAQAGRLAPTPITSFAEYAQIFDGFAPEEYLAHAVQGFFQNGGVRCYVLSLPREIKSDVSESNQSAVDITSPAGNLLVPLDALDEISIVCGPDEHAVAGMTAALVAHCEQHRDRIAILAAPLNDDLSNDPPEGAQSSFAAYYAPWVLVPDPTGGAALAAHPGGHIAGAMVRSDLEHGVWKVPANLPIRGIVGLTQQITAQQQLALSEQGINALRNFPEKGYLVWGARTTSQDPEWKYVNIRRYFSYLEKSIDQGTQWVVFEPNGEALWEQVRQSISNFLFNEWKSGALQGDKPEQAYFVRCDRTTMTQDDIDNGRLVCLIGVAALRPAEFVIFRIGQWTANATPPCP